MGRGRKVAERGKERWEGLRNEKKNEGRIDAGRGRGKGRDREEGWLGKVGERWERGEEIDRGGMEEVKRYIRKMG